MSHSTQPTKDPSDPDSGTTALPPQHFDLSGAASRELAEAFADAVVSGDSQGLRPLLSERVVYQLPGRSAGAGLHRGREHVTAALTQPVAPGTFVDHVEVTETMSDGNRAMVIVLLEGRAQGEPFAVEVALHLETDGESIIGVTEYSGNQYLVDSMLTGSAATGDKAASSRRRRPWHRRRR